MKSVIALVSLFAAVQAIPQAAGGTACVAPTGLPACITPCFPKLTCPTGLAAAASYICGPGEAQLAGCGAASCTDAADIGSLLAAQSSQCAALAAKPTGSPSPTASASASASASESAPVETSSGGAAPAVVAPTSGNSTASGAGTPAVQTGSSSSGSSTNSSASGTGSASPTATGSNSGAERVVAGASLILAAFAAVLAL